MNSATKSENKTSFGVKTFPLKSPDAIPIAPEIVASPVSIITNTVEGKPKASNSESAKFSTISNNPCSIR